VDGDSNMKVILDATVDVETRAPAAAQSVTMLGNQPNPFNASTAISFTLPAGTHTASATVYDIKGREVGIVLSGARLAAGLHSVTWNAGGAANGVYLFKLNVDGKVYKQRLMLAR
jgi:hypothetical protein